MSTPDNVRVFSGAFVFASYTEIVCVDADEEGSLAGYSVDIVYEPCAGGPSIQWPIGTVTPITALNKAGQTIVRGLIIPVVPILPPQTNLGRLYADPQAIIADPDEPVGSGMLMGTLNPPPASPGAGSPVTAKTPKKFQIDQPVIYFGMPIPMNCSKPGHG